MVHLDPDHAGRTGPTQAPGARPRGGAGAAGRVVARSHPTTSVTRSVGPAPAKVLVIAAPGGSDLASALRDQGFEVKASWPSAIGQLRAVLGWRPHAVLVDGAEPDGPGRELVRAVARGAAPVVVLVSRLTGPVRDELARLGATSVLSRRRPVREIATTIRHLVEQERRRPRRPSTAGPEWRPPRSAEPRRARFDRLTPREQAVLRSLIEGMPASVIALESSVSVSTVRTQIRAILQKLNVNSQLQAVSLARQAGWPTEASPAGRPSRGAG